jgi:hypothetical protein
LLALTACSGFKADGTNDRALAVLEVRDGAATTVSPAPRVLEGQIYPACAAYGRRRRRG